MFLNILLIKANTYIFSVIFIVNVRQYMYLVIYFVPKVKV